MDNIEGVATVSVPKSKAVFQTGKKKGKLRKGCRWSGRGTKCSPEVAARLGVKRSKGKGKGKGKKASKGKRRPPDRQAMMRTPGGQLFLALQNRRRAYREAVNAGSCKGVKTYGREVIGILGRMWELPVKGGQDKLFKRNSRYKTEMANVVKTSNNICKGIPAEFQGTRGRGKLGGHPCASPNPPAWCNKKRRR